MKTELVLSAALLAAASVSFAQEPPAQKPKEAAELAVQEVKRAEHDALKSLVGTWDCKARISAVPGVPGMEKPTESSGVERAELICDGLWLKWTTDGSMLGQPFHGVWLAGYDPFQKKYVSVCVDNREAAPSEMVGGYDAKSKTWTWSGNCAQGAMRSRLVWKDADTMVETCWMTPPDGKEMQTMEFTRTRSKARAPVGVAEAAARGAAEIPAELAMLHKDVGEWKAVVKMATDPGQPATEEKCTEIVRAICDGKYTWSDFKGTIMGAPFEGHGVIGYDAESKQYVSYWIDTMSATWSRTTGTYDAASKSVTMEGSCLDPAGQPMTMKQVLTWPSETTRRLKMEFKSGDQTNHMEIAYERAPKR